jgi:hypothetical protein
LELLAVTYLGGGHVACVIALFASLLLLMLILSLIVYWTKGSRDIVISNHPITIGIEWQAIGAPKPLTSRRSVQRILLKLGATHQQDTESWGIRLPSGDVAFPEVELLDGDGLVYPLAEPSFSTVGAARYRGFGGSAGFPTDRTFAKIRLRSNHPIEVPEIIWSCFDPK